MNLRKSIIMAVAALFAASASVVGCAAAAHASGGLVCQTVLVEENSGNGPNYPLKVCNQTAVFKSPGYHKEWVLIVDGGPLPEKSTKTATIVLAEVK